MMILVSMMTNSDATTACDNDHVALVMLEKKEPEISVGELSVMLSVWGLVGGDYEPGCVSENNTGFST